FDLMVGDGSVRPGPAEGRAACDAATAWAAHGEPVPIGRVGAGTGAMIGQVRGREHAREAGIGAATERDGDLVVSALVAVNAFGDLRDAHGRPTPDASDRPDTEGFGHTTLGVVVTNAGLDKVG